MTFEELLDQAIALLQRRGRLTYRALKRQFNIDDDYLEDLKAELIQGQRLAVDEEGQCWSGRAIRGGRRPSRSPHADAGPGTARLYPEAPGREDPHVAQRPRRRAQAGHRPVRRCGRLHHARRAARSRDRARPHQSLLERITAVHRFEGTINQYTGDGVMALFGAPIAHEDSPRRAVHAALGIQRAIRDVAQALQAERGLTLQMRIGVHTGLVVVGKIGDDLRMDYTAVGDTTNLAARLQQMAQPGSVVISAATQQHIAGFFETRDLGEMPVGACPGASLRGAAASRSPDAL